MISQTNVINTLHLQAPFDVVPTETLATVAASIAERQLADGAVIVTRDTPLRDLFVIVEGKVDVRNDSGITETLVANEAFPVEVLTRSTELVSENDYVAHGDVGVLVISAAVIAHLRSVCAEFDEFFVRKSIIDQQFGGDFGGARSALNLDLHRLLPKRTVARLPPQASINQVVEKLHTSKAREVVIVEDGAPIGIFTRSDLVSRVLMSKVNLETPVCEVMTHTLVTLPASARGFDAVIEMHRRGVSRIVLLDDNHHFAGVISDGDLLYALQDSSNLHYLIIHAETEAELCQASDKIRELVTGLVNEGVEAENLTRLLSTLNDHLNERIIELAAARAQIAMDSFCWIALGSEGRHEQTLHTDQDNALIFTCDNPDHLEETRRKMMAFAMEVNTLLDKCGFPFCSGNIMASNPECCLTFDEWRRRFAQWIDEPNPQALLSATIYFDLRPLCGNKPLCDSLIDWLMNAVHNNRRFFHLMMENALQRTPPIGLFRNFAVDKVDSCLDIKLSGVAILVDGARLYGLATGCRSSSTIDRFRSAEKNKLLTPEDTANCLAAFDIIQRIRLRQHNTQLLKNLPTTNRINPFALNNIDRKGLLEAFRHANNLQKMMNNRFNIEMRR